MPRVVQVGFRKCGIAWDIDEGFTVKDYSAGARLKKHGILMEDPAGVVLWPSCPSVPLLNVMFTHQCAPHSHHSTPRGGPHSRHSSGGGSDA